MQSTYSINGKKGGVHYFAIEFRDSCWDSELQAPVFDIYAYKFEVWQQQAYLFDSMKDLTQDLACGGFTYEILYIAGSKIGLTNPMNGFSFELVSLSRM